MEASTPPQFDINVRGRVDNIKLGKKYFLLSLLDAVVNSFQAIDHEKKKYGKKETSSDEESSSLEKYYVDIIIVHDAQMDFDDEGKLIHNKISGFIVEDNGIGFDDANFTSFRTSDSEYKKQDGGRGVGRFLWLKEFESVRIESTYQLVDSSFQSRCFDFNVDAPFLCNYTEVYSNGPRKTIVKLNSMKKEFAKLFVKTLDDIAMRIVEYCLAYFLKSDCPEVTIRDDKKTISLNGLFREKIKTESEEVCFSIGHENFKLLHVLVEDATNRNHRLHLMADERDVVGIKVTNYIVDLKNEINREGRKYWYAGFLYGDYLNKHVTENRTSIEIDDDEPISQDQIIKRASLEIEEYLKPMLQQIREEKETAISDFITNKAPEYRALIKHKPEQLKQIEPGLSEDRLDEELNKIKREFEKEIEKETETILKGVRNPCMDGYEKFESLMENNLKKITDANRSTLAQYVTRRKAVLDILDEALNIGEDQKYQKERYIHDLIFPIRKTLDQLPEDQYNLWLIDEKLAFYFFLASSDLPFKAIPNDKRPDMMFLDRPIATTDDDEKIVHDTIVIFELKQPERNDYTETDNPIKQLYDYVYKIKKGTKDAKGRTITVNSSTKYYLYAICDITPTLIPLLDTYDNTNMMTPDGLGRFWYNKPLNAYVEVIPFKKLITDSKRRNKILFKKLGL